jgi:hypothetical protein
MQLIPKLPGPYVLACYDLRGLLPHKGRCSLRRTVICAPLLAVRFGCSRGNLGAPGHKNSQVL